MLLRTTTTVSGHQQLGCDTGEAQPSSVSHSSVGHQPCQAGDYSQVKGEKGSGLYQYPMLLLSIEELLRDKLQGLNNYQSGNNLM